MKWMVRKIKVFRLIKDFIKKATEDSLPAYAAQATFFVLLSFFPFLILLVMVLSKVSFMKTNIILHILDFAPEQLDDYILYMVNDILFSNSNSFTIITVLVTIWSSAKGIQALTYGLNKIYKVEKTKNYIFIRLVSAIYTLIFMLICIAIMVVYIFGANIVKKIIDLKPSLANATILVFSLKGVFSYIIIFGIILIIYYQLPERKGKLKDEFIGAAFAALAWMGITKGFSLYVQYLSGNSYMYGSLTSLILAIVWLYFEMQIILYGAEINYFVNTFFLDNKKSDRKDIDTVI